MVLKERILVHITQLVSTSDQVADLEVLVGMEVPKLVLVQTWELDSSWNKHAVSLSSDLLKWSLNSIKNCLQDS